ncbi:hypothetical protein WR25_04223 isoform D [Diploscapter pachys]|nr:hypothetical protein WR25_04223 isoform C [Diploscapter pachys]PAV67707.1 hypothetical protein WR25_04223 isoform D [Diploscapter pachys]
MDLVVYLALGVLAVVFIISFIVLIVMCHRRRTNLKRLKKTNPLLRYSKIRTENLDNVVQLSPLMAQVLDKNTWVYDVTGLLQHCVAILRLSHTLSQKLSAVPLNQVSPELMEAIKQATIRVMPRFDDLLSSVASPSIDARILEARASALATVCWALYMPYSLVNQRCAELFIVPLREMEGHLDALRESAFTAERNDLMKLEVDWTHVDALASAAVAAAASSRPQAPFNPTTSSSLPTTSNDTPDDDDEPTTASDTAPLVVSTPISDGPVTGATPSNGCIGSTVTGQNSSPTSRNKT